MSRDWAVCIFFFSMCVCIFRKLSRPDIPFLLLVHIWHILMTITCLIFYNNFVFFLSHVVYKTLLKHTSIHRREKKLTAVWSGFIILKKNPQQSKNSNVHCRVKKVGFLCVIGFLAFFSLKRYLCKRKKTFMVCFMRCNLCFAISKARKTRGWRQNIFF